MTDDEAKEWVAARYGAMAVARLGELADIVTGEAKTQNLIAPSTLATIWTRHLIDSAQLLDLVPPMTADDHWIDIGSGAGFPGLVIALLADCAVTLVEPRKRRAAFLEEVVDSFRLQSTRVEYCKIERITDSASVISARAVAPISSLFDWATGCSNVATRWVLPKGRSALEEVAKAQQAWQGVFHVEQSITDPGSMIVLASGVTRR